MPPPWPLPPLPPSPAPPMARFRAINELDTVRTPPFRFAMPPPWPFPPVGPAPPMAWLPRIVLWSMRGGRGHGHGKGDSPENVVRDRAAPAVLPNGAGAGSPADGPVVRERAMTDGEDRVAKASDVPDGAARARAEAARDAVVEPADGLIVAEHTVADGEGASSIRDGAADAGAAGADAGRTADGLVVEERAVADGGRGRRARGPIGHDGSAERGAADAARSAVRANGLVVDEATVADGEGPCVEDAAAEGVHDGAEARAGRPTTRLSDRMAWERVRVPAFKMPPPCPTARPWVTVRSSMLTATPLLIWKTRLASLPLTASRSAPGPSMVRSSVMLSWPPVSAMVPSRAAGAKRIRSAPGALLAVVIASRSDPGPLSRKFKTEKVLSRRRSSSASRHSREAGERRRVGRRRVEVEVRDLKKVGNLMGISFASLVCDTMERHRSRVRRPSAGAVPGR